MSRKIVDGTIIPASESWCSTKEAVDNYHTFGEDPWIVSNVSVFDEAYFNAWSYAEKRARELYKMKHHKF